MSWNISYKVRVRVVTTTSQSCVAMNKHHTFRIFFYKRKFSKCQLSRMGVNWTVQTNGIFGSYGCVIIGHLNLYSVNKGTCPIVVPVLLASHYYSVGSGS